MKIKAKTKDFSNTTTLTAFPIKAVNSLVITYHWCVPVHVSSVIYLLHSTLFWRSVNATVLHCMDT